MKNTGNSVGNTDWALETRRNTLLYPDDDVVRMVSRYRSKLGDKPARALDIGCGSGRHMKLLIEKKFETLGLDHGPEAIAVANEVFGEVPGYQGAICADFRDYKFEHEYEFILLWGALFLAPVSEMPANLAQLIDLLTDDGIICFNLRTKDNWFYGLGKEIEDGTFLLDDRAGPYANLTYSFHDEADARMLVQQAGGTINSIEKVTMTKENLSQFHSWLQISVSKN